MLIFKHTNKKVIIITEHRTGSTVLAHATSYSDLELFEPPDIVLSDQILQMLNTMQTQGWQIALCIKDPMERRRSALELISLKSDTNNLASRAYFLRGLIAGNFNTYHGNIISTGYFNYTLNDFHLDWGTSCYYHLFVNQGIFPRLLHLHRGVDSDWSYTKSHVCLDFTEFMLELFDHEPKAQEKFKLHSEVYIKKYGQNHNSLPLSDTEASRMYLYDVYKKSIVHNTYIKNWGSRHEFLYDKDILRFSEWEDMELMMYESMVGLINGDQKLRSDSSKHVLRSVLSRLINCYGLDKGAILPTEIGNWYPSRNLLTHISSPLDYLKNLTNT